MDQRKRLEEVDWVPEDEVGRKEELPGGSLPRVEGLVSKSVIARKVVR